MTEVPLPGGAGGSLPNPRAPGGAGGVLVIPDARGADYPGAPVGFNGRLFVKSYGSRFVRVKDISFGLNIISSPPESSAHGRAFYPVVTTGSSFRMTIEHKSVRERDNFNGWVKRYMERVSHNDDSVAGFMSIEVPCREFFRTSVPTGTLDWNDKTGEITYQTNLDFLGASDPLALTHGGKRSDKVSYAIIPEGIGRYFYPTGDQSKSSLSALDGALFDIFDSALGLLTQDQDPAGPPSALERFGESDF